MEEFDRVPGGDPGDIENAENAPESGEKEEQKVVSIYYEAPPEDTEVIGVRFRTSGKVYYFDPEKKKYPEGCHAIVETARGQEFGFVAQTNHIVSGREIVLPLRKALRIATPEDEKHDKENLQKAEEAFLIGNKKIAEHGLDMKLIDTEYTFDNTKLLFYFTSEGRVDFRELVKDLASVFRCRIELRQMGIRDEAKVLGGLGTCGRPFCCHAFLPDFVQVSIKMAKEQNLSLNAAKISGACGRLMCCLRYEYDTYLEEGRLTPKVDSMVNTPDGIGVVIEAKPLVGLVKVRSLDDNAGAPRVYHRDQLSPIKKGDDNYEKALEEKTLEKQARAAGTTRAALKAAKADPEKAAEKQARAERIQRAQRPAPQRAASYTGQVMPSALESSPKTVLPEDAVGNENKEQRSKSGRSRRNRGRGHGGNKENRENGAVKPVENVGSAQPGNENRTENRGENQGERAARYEKTSRGARQPAAASGKQVTSKREQPRAAEAPAEQKKQEGGEQKAHHNYRHHHRRGGGKGGNGGSGGGGGGTNNAG